jgi:Predicted glycosyltransferases
MISVIIASYNRSKKLKTTVECLLKNKAVNYEIIVVEQSKNKLKNPFGSLKKITYINTQKINKSTALNTAIHRASGDILVFIDDDIIVSPRYLHRVQKFFDDRKNKDYSGIFGPILAFEPKKHPGMYCPGVFFSRHLRADKKRIVTRNSFSFKGPVLQGNNFAVRRGVFDTIGYFKEYLGLKPGQLVVSSEDTELFCRILEADLTLVYLPDLKVYHNRWLKPPEMEMHESRYTSGLAFVYYLYILQNRQIVKGLLYPRLENRILRRGAKLLKYLISFRFRKLYYQKRELIYILVDIFSFVSGFLAALISVFILGSGNASE